MNSQVYCTSTTVHHYITVTCKKKIKAWSNAKFRLIVFVQTLLLQCQTHRSSFALCVSLHFLYVSPLHHRESTIQYVNSYSSGRKKSQLRSPSRVCSWTNSVVSPVVVKFLEKKIRLCMSLICGRYKVISVQYISVMTSKYLIQIFPCHIKCHKVT